MSLRTGYQIPSYPLGLLAFKTYGTSFVDLTFGSRSLAVYPGVILQSCSLRHSSASICNENNRTPYKTLATSLHTPLRNFMTSNARSLTESSDSWRCPAKQHLLADVLTGVASGLLVSPFVAIIDKSIVLNSSGSMNLQQAVVNGVKQMFRQPLHFLRRPEFLMVFGVYSATYVTANTVSSFCKSNNITSSVPKFLATTAVNMTSWCAAVRHCSSALTERSLCSAF